MGSGRIGPTGRSARGTVSGVDNLDTGTATALPRLMVAVSVTGECPWSGRSVRVAVKQVSRRWRVSDEINTI